MGSVPHVDMCKDAEHMVKVVFLPAKGSRSPLEAFGKVPRTKNNFWGHFLNRIRFSSYLACQNV